MNRRHLTAAALGWLSLVGVIVASCTAEYTWQRRGPPASRVQWIPVDRATMYAMCNQTPENFPNLGGCAFYTFTGGDCYVYSSISEFQSHRTFSGDGLSLYQHEVGEPGKPYGHCNGYDHPNVLPNR